MVKPLKKHLTYNQQRIDENKMILMWNNIKQLLSKKALTLRYKFKKTVLK